jgi:chromosomal replication initiator protein
LSAELDSRPERAADLAGSGSPVPAFIRDNTPFQSCQEFWQAVQESIKERLGQERFSVWFRQTELMRADEDGLVVGVPNVIIQQFLTLRYTEAVASAVQELVERPVKVTFDVAPRLFRRMRDQREVDRAAADRAEGGLVEPSPARAQPYANPHWSFESLVCTRANRLPFAAARELAGQANPRFRFVYVYGGFGLGKTALMHAMLALASGPEVGLDPVYSSAEDWCNGYYRAIQRNTTHAFRARYRSCGMLLLDDVQFVDGKAAAQRELLHTVKQLLTAGSRVALSGVPHPRQMAEVDPSLQALLEGAFPALLLPPEKDECADIVRRLAARRRLDAVPEVFDFVAEVYGGSFRAMEAALDCLAFHTSVEGCGKLELAAARRALSTLRPGAGQPVTAGRIMELVAGALPVTVEQLKGRSRTRTVCLGRQLAIYLARKHTAGSLTEIGQAFGGLSHSTVKHSADKIAGELAQDARLAELLARLEKDLAG